MIGNAVGSRVGDEDGLNVATEGASVRVATVGANVATEGASVRVAKVGLAVICSEAVGDAVARVGLIVI
jgi:hypothetical protein